MVTRRGGVGELAVAMKASTFHGDSEVIEK